MSRVRFLNRFVLALVSAVVLNGCATRAVQTEAMLAHPTPGLPAEAHVDGVPFIKQTANHCGPATLAMALQWAARKSAQKSGAKDGGRLITVEELSRTTFTPAASGTYQSDMITASRREGMLAIPVKGLPSLLTEIAAGHPAIIFENQAFTWYPLYHYALVYG